MVAAETAVETVPATPRAALFRASLVLLAVAGLSKLTTLAADSFVAARFGLSSDTDAYLLAIGLIGALVGAPSETVRLAIVPICGEHLGRGDRRGAAGVTALALAGVTLAGAVATACLVAQPLFFARIAAPGLEEPAAGTLALLIRILAVTCALGLITAVLLGVLHAQLRFGAPAVIGIGLSLGVLACGVLLANAIGVKALAVGYVAGSAIVLGVLAWLALDIFRDGADLRAARGQIWPLLRLAFPTGLAIAVVSLGAVVERAFASTTGSGNVAALGLAIKLMTQAGVVAQSIWMPLTPLLTASGASAGRKTDLHLVPFSIRLVLLALVPATALVIALAHPLVAAIFERGAFTATDTARTAMLLALHSGSLVGEGLFMVAVAALLSLHDSGTRLVASVLFITCKVLLMVGLTPVTGVAGIAIAASLSSLVAGAYSVRALYARLPRFELTRLLYFGGKVVCAGAVALCAAALTSVLFEAATGSTSLGIRLGQLGTGGAAGLTAYFVALRQMEVEEARLLLGGVRQRLAGGWG